MKTSEKDKIPEANVDDILTKLLAAKISKVQKPVNLLENEIKWLAIKVKIYVWTSQFILNLSHL